jgi:hypothetical protein
MALTVENGSLVAGANSYVSIEDARAYAADRGLSLPDDAAECADVLVRAADYVDSFRSRFVGMTVSADQSMEWPRTGVYIRGRALSQTSVPALLVNAQVEAAVILAAGIDLMPYNSSSRLVKREKIGPLETEYETTGGGGSIVPRTISVERLLQPLFRGGGGPTRTERA